MLTGCFHSGLIRGGLPFRVIDRDLDGTIAPLRPAARSTCRVFLGVGSSCNV